MRKEETYIRIASEADAEGLLEIYAPYVQETAVTFEYEVPSVEEFAGRISRIQQKFPYFVAESGSGILGYAYAGPFHTRAAYSWAVETTVYVREEARKKGVGKMLYGALEKALSAQNIVNLNACIAYPPGEDPYLTKDSVEFHRYMGYRMVGRFSQCGYKFQRWYDMVWMEKHIGPHLQGQPPVKNFEEVKEEIREKYDIH